MSKVTVTEDKNGNIVTISDNNPEFGFIKVSQLVTQIANGWLRQVVRTAIINGKLDDLVEAKFKKGQELPGKIVIIESFNPFNLKNPDQDLKIAGDTGVICRVDDQPIYRQSVYTVNDQAQDEFIMHDNSYEIKEVATIQKSLVKAKPVEEKEPAIQL
jgi:hypothetical protein